MARAISLTVIIFVGLGLLMTFAQPFDSALAAVTAKTETPPPTLDPSQPTATITPLPTDLPTATPEPAQPTGLPPVVVWITATPQRVPPSWQIPDLDKKIKDKKGAVRNGPQLGLTLQIEPNPIPPELDQTISDFMVWLIDRQRMYYDLPAGRYAQMLPSHSAPPADGFGEYPDGWFNHPTDQQYAWADLLAFQFEPLQFRVTVDQYSGPEGSGFVASFDLLVDGVLWRRAVNYGPEALRNTEWEPVQEAQP